MFPLIKIITFCLLMKLAKNLSLNISENTENQIIKCVGKVYKYNPESYTFLSSTLNAYLLNDLVITANNVTIINFKQNITPINLKYKYMFPYQMFIFLIKTIEEYKDAISHLKNTSIWNSRAKFVVGYTGNDLKELFTISWQNYIINIDIVAANENSVNVYTYFPYTKNVCGGYKSYDILKSCNENSLNNLFPQKIPFDLNGCKIRAMPYTLQPYVINVSMPKEESGKAGIEITILHNVANRMNITINYLKNPHKHWGYLFRDGSFSMMYKALNDREVDIIFGFTYSNQSYSPHFDSSYNHLGDASVWFFPTAQEIAQWKNLTNIFEKRLWLAIFLMFLFNGFSWWFIGRTREKTDDFNDLVICIMSSMYVLLQGSVQGPSIWKLRLVFILWLVTCLLIYTAHQCQLISILTTTLYERQMTTLEELVESGSEYGFYPTIEDAYQTNSTRDKTILKMYQTCPLSAECLNRTAFQKDYAVVKNRRQVLYFMPRYYTYPNGRPMLYDTGIAAFTTKETYYVRKGYPLLEIFNRMLMLLSANGLINKWDKDTRFYIYKIESDPDHEPLSLGHLQGAFFMFSFGMMAAIITFFCEIIVKKCKQMCRKKNYDNITSKRKYMIDNK